MIENLQINVKKVQSLVNKLRGYNERMLRHTVFDPGKINSLLSGKYARHKKRQNKSSPLYTVGIHFIRCSCRKKKHCELFFFADENIKKKSRPVEWKIKKKFRFFRIFQSQKILQKVFFYSKNHGHHRILIWYYLIWKNGLCTYCRWFLLAILNSIPTLYFYYIHK